MEVLWTVATAVLFFTMVLAGVQSFSDLYLTPAPDDAIPIEVTGQQFAWNIRYPGPDGEFGQTDPQLVNDAIGNPLGLDDADAAARDDLVLPTMAIPVNRPIKLILKSKDVTHSFFVRELRIKQDTVPGMVIPIHFTANRTGTFEISPVPNSAAWDTIACVAPSKCCRTRNTRSGCGNRPNTDPIVKPHQRSEKHGGKHRNSCR